MCVTVCICPNWSGEDNTIAYLAIGTCLLCVCMCVCVSGEIVERVRARAINQLQHVYMP